MKKRAAQMTYILSALVISLTVEVKQTMFKENNTVIFSNTFYVSVHGHYSYFQASGSVEEEYVA